MRPQAAKLLIDALEPRRMLAAGALDNSFSQDGKSAITAGGGVVLSVNDVALQSDGKVVVVGEWKDSATSDIHRVAVARFNFDGTPDTTFGTGGNGLVRFNIGNQQYDVGRCVAIQGDGKIVVGAASFQRDDVLRGAQFGVARLNANGSLDTSFSGDGKKTIDFGGFANDIVLQSVNTTSGIVQKIVIAGENTGTFSTNQDFAIARLNPNGALDGTFSSDGKQEIGFGFDEEAFGVAIDTQNRIVVTGNSGNTGGLSPAVTRLIGNTGAKDTTFGDNGTARATFPGDPFFSGGSVLMQSDNRIVVVGGLIRRSDSARSFGMVRFLSTGQVDKTFGVGLTGFVNTDMGGLDIAYDAITSADGSITVAGRSGNRFALARYTADGVLQSNFGIGGKIIGDFTGAGGVSDSKVAIARGPGRRFVIAGAGMGAARFLDTGANVVNAGTFQPQAFEEGRKPTSFLVTRSERLPTPTRVFFSVGGTANFKNTSFGLFPSNDDYDMTGFTFNRDGSAGGYVDIPANETFVNVTLTPIDDTRPEGNESALFSIVPSADYDLGRNDSLKITVVDNDSQTLTATADAFVRDGADATKNFGTGSTLDVKKAPTIGFNRQAYLKFSIPTLGTINSVKLRVFGSLSGTTNSSIAASVFAVADTGWSETGITFNNRPAIGSTALSAFTVTGTAGSFYDIDVTSYVKAQKALGKTSLSFAILANVTTSELIRLGSRESANGSSLFVT